MQFKLQYLVVEFENPRIYIDLAQEEFKNIPMAGWLATLIYRL